MRTTDGGQGDGHRVEDESADVWYRYESEGLNELRMDERFDSNANGHLDGDGDWRVGRYTV